MLALLLTLLLGSLVTPALAQPPRTFALRPSALAETKQRLAAGDTLLQPALQHLLAEADAALHAGPFSVVNKTMPPPSGDKHDYLSFGPYWWPNPDTPDGLPYVRRDGETNPEARTGASDSPRMGRMTSAVETLALAYYLTETEAYAAHAARLLRTWFLDPATRMNPHLRFGQAIPGRVDGRGIGIIDTRRLIAVVDAVGLLASSAAWTDADQTGMEAWFDAYLTWLLTSPHGLSEAGEHNNHGTWYDAQVASFALFLDKPEVAYAVLRGVRKRRLPQHIRPDGSQPHELDRTRSFDYSTMNLQGFFTLAVLGEHVDLDLWHHKPDEGGSLRQALDVLAPYADPSQTWPHRQITPRNPLRLLPLLRQAAIVYEAPEYEASIERLPDPENVAAHRVHLLYPPPRF